VAGAGVKLFASGDVLLASEVNTFLQDQVIMRFATTTARDNAFGGAGEPTLAEGMFAYIDADNSLYYYSGSAWSKYVINLTVDTKTNDYTFVAGDVDKRVVANKASAIAFTVNNSIFSAGDTLAVHNINTGLLTLTAGAGVTINGADVLTVAQYQGGTLFFTSASSAIFFPTAKTVSAGGLVFISNTAFTTATSVSLPANTFTSTYTNYRVIFTVTASTTTGNITGRVRTSGTDNTSSRYFQVSPGMTIAAGGSASNQTNDGTSSFTLGTQGSSTTPCANFVLDFLRPNVNDFQKTAVGSQLFLSGGNYIGRSTNLIFDNNGVAFQIDSFSFISSAASSMTGNVRVYGYADS